MTNSPTNTIAVHTDATPHGAGDGLMGIDALANKLGYGRTTLYLMRQEGKILEPTLTRGRRMRWDPRDVQGWIDAGCPTADEWRRAKGRGRGPRAGARR